MMNKLQSARVHLVKFLFVVPLLAVILISFRQKKQDTPSSTEIYKMSLLVIRDTVPEITEPNNKGYIINLKDCNTTCTIVIKDKNGKEVESLLLTKWNENEKYYQEKYGEIPPSPPATPKYLEGTVSREVFLQRNPDVKNVGWVFHYGNTISILHITKKDGSTESYDLDKQEEREKFEKKYGKIPYPPPPPTAPVPPVPPVAPSPVKLPADVKSIHVNNDKATIYLNNGNKESYDLSIPEQKAAFEKKYGELVEPPATPIHPSAPGSPAKVVVTDGTDNLSTLADEFEITDKKAVIHLRNGKTEVYDLTNKNSRLKFEMKFGKIIKTGVNAHVSTNVNAASNVSVHSQVNTSNHINTAVSPVAVVNHGSQTNIISSASPVVAVGGNIHAIDPYDHKITGEEEILVTITRKTTADQLEAFKKQMKEKGIELNFDDIDFDNGKLVRISGTMKSKDGKSKSTFSVTDFHKVILASIKNGDKTYFKVDVTDNKTVI